MKYRKGSLITGKELKFAFNNKIKVWYVEIYENPLDKHMNFNGPSTMEPATIGAYIGNSDINPEEFKDDEFVEFDFDEGSCAVYKIKGMKYEENLNGN